MVNETTTTTSPNFVNITVPEDGQYIFNATSTDTVNNQNNLASRAIFVDTVIPPNIQFVAPTPANNTNLAENNFSINIYKYSSISLAPHDCFESYKILLVMLLSNNFKKFILRRKRNWFY